MERVILITLWENGTKFSIFSQLSWKHEIVDISTETLLELSDWMMDLVEDILDWVAIWTLRGISAQLLRLEVH